MVAITSFSNRESILTDKTNGMKLEPADEQTDEPSFSDPEDFVDRIDDSELLEDVLRAKPNEQEFTDAVVVIDGLPKVGKEKMEKLKTVIVKTFSGPLKRNILNVYHPEAPNPDLNGEATTKGYCFLEFQCREYAMEAVQLSGFKLDKTHTLTVTSFRDFEKLHNTEDLENWEPPKPRPYKDRGNLRSWLLNPDCLDQFVLQSEGGDKVGVYWNSTSEATKVAEKMHWSDTFVRWSPFGTYLATVHKQGVALWGGEKFEQIMKFSHAGVQFLDFSPCEKYIVTYAPPKARYAADVTDAIKIWVARTGELKMTAPAGDAVKRWPHFKWSSDDEYFAALGTDENSLRVYDTNTFSLLEKKRVHVENARDFQWSPKGPLIAYWASARGHESMARVAVMNLGEKKDEKAPEKTKNVQNLADASIHWQKSGDNVCFKVERYGKKKEREDGEFKYSNITVQLEIFHMRVKDVPVTTFDMKEAVQTMAWEPVGTKLCIIQGDMRSSINIYSAKYNPVGVTHLKTLEHKGQVNSIFWSPHGQYLVCAGLKTTAGGLLQFIDCSQTEPCYMTVQEHPGVTEVEWDPTGRCVVSSVSTWTSGSSRAMDFGYMIWNFQGRPLARRPVDMFCAFAWRPRPPALLSDAKIKEIKKNMKKYAAEFDEKDRRKLDKASQEVSEKRRKQMEDFKAWREQHARQRAAEEEMRAKLRCEADESIAFDEETIEFLINQEETIDE